MRIRVTGTREEISAVLPVLADVLDVLEASEFYLNRGNSMLGRMYLDIGGVRATPARAVATRSDTEQSAIEHHQEGGEPR